MNKVRGLLRRLHNAWHGIWYAICHDRSFRLQVVVGIPAAISVWYLAWPVSDLELFLIIMATFLVLITELQNTAFETALDRIHPERHEKIGLSKDMIAGSVLLAALFAAAVVGFLIHNRIF